MATVNSYNSLTNFDLPRTISAGLKVRIFFNDPLAFIGIFFFLFGGLFPILFFQSVDFKTAFTFKDNDPAVKGIIDNKTRTGNSQNKNKIYEYAYHYTVNNKTYNGISYSTSQKPEIADSVTIQYVPAQQEVSRIQGMGAAPFSFIILPFTFLFPVIGFIFFVSSIKRGKKNIYLVQNGILTTGRVTRKEPTTTKVNKQTVYKVFFEYKTQDGQLKESFVKSHKIANLGDEKEEPLVYDSQNPTEAVLLDSLPKKIRPLLTGQY